MTEPAPTEEEPVVPLLLDSTGEKEPLIPEREESPLVEEMPLPEEPVAPEKEVEEEKLVPPENQGPPSPREEIVIGEESDDLPGLEEVPSQTPFVQEEEVNECVIIIDAEPQRCIECGKIARKIDDEKKEYFCTEGCWLIHAKPWLVVKAINTSAELEKERSERCEPLWHNSIMKQCWLTLQGREATEQARYEKECLLMRLEEGSSVEVIIYDSEGELRESHLLSPGHTDQLALPQGTVHAFQNLDPRKSAKLSLLFVTLAEQ